MRERQSKLLGSPRRKLPDLHLEITAFTYLQAMDEGGYKVQERNHSTWRTGKPRSPLVCRTDKSRICRSGSQMEREKTENRLTQSGIRS